ncbi:hypothetical protein [Geobacillus thermodenitrificans]|uniref:Uncharacterized protein n=2 Tax=Geobacillus TaxID=129337 RepID=A0ABY9QI97_GEOTD|nr:hypothetical protein [Geobacillus thermodenitrificans]WMV78180.1 hypothetical protein HSX42_12185 [Geobacillus thermodenitrificans]
MYVSFMRWKNAQANGKQQGGEQTVTNRNDNRKRKNKYPNNREEIGKEWDIQKDPTPENNNRYGSPSHKQ